MTPHGITGLERVKGGNNNENNKLTFKVLVSQIWNMHTAAPHAMHFIYLAKKDT
jgi:hypothetical protein